MKKILAVMLSKAKAKGVDLCRVFDKDDLCSMKCNGCPFYSTKGNYSGNMDKLIEELEEEK